MTRLMMTTTKLLRLMLCHRLMRHRRRLHVIFSLASFTLLIYVLKQSLDVTDNSSMATSTHPPPAAVSSGCSDRPLIQLRTDDVPIIWIGGVPRSGTTLMRVALDAHPDVECGAETRVIPRMLSVHAAMERSDAETTYLEAAGVTNDTIDRALAAYILTVLTRHHAAATRRRLCNKDPFTLRSMQRLVRLFPRSRFVLMIRDGRAVADSIVSGHVTIRGFDVETHRGAPIVETHHDAGAWRRTAGHLLTGTAPCRPCSRSA